MAAHVGPRPDGMQVCHNNGLRTDNRLSNLRYDTASGNMRDRILHGTDPKLRQTHCPHDHLLAGRNLKFRPCGARRCASCSYAASLASKLRRRGQDVGDVRALADAKYALLMTS
jgi:hypothetical protein